MIKPLAFKGDKKSKKRKAPHPESTEKEDSRTLTLQSTTAADSEEDDSWVTAEAATDITGPVIFVLPSAKPTCIACDANGKVFASELENIVEGDLATAEPHDVRQVFLASRIAGTEEISFKGHHGRYLSCDTTGVLSATREAISREESFLCIPSPESLGTFSIQTVREKFFAILDESKVPEIHGNAESVSFNTTLRIRMQARFKPRLKANKESKVREKISRKELEEAVGRKLDDVEVRRLKKARLQGDYYEAILDVRVKGKHDKYS
ncbi:hypothetical protein N7G274_007871 [Stereocaulon virgatum]|uniref:Actin-crosslinking protein n=1 Tax=Stereocaulon virgatum TaxID=373712 RepID=A0ABR4A7A7_9LECA